MTAPMKPGREPSSPIKHLRNGSNGPEPTVGMGATILHWTDRTAGTIVEVGDGYFVVQADHAICTDELGRSD